MITAELEAADRASKEVADAAAVRMYQCDLCGTNTAAEVCSGCQVRYCDSCQADGWNYTDRVDTSRPQDHTWWCLCNGLSQDSRDERLREVRDDFAEWVAGMAATNPSSRSLTLALETA